MPAVAAQAQSELSVQDRLKDRREVAAGTRAYSVGFQDGGFYANGWHITGEMGGIWAPPLKLADGVWFGVDDAWVGAATKFTSGRGYVRYDLPPLSGLALRRTDFVPDGKRAALYGLELSNPGGAAKTVTVKADVHSELMTAYPWGWTTPNADDANLADTAAVDHGALVFSDATAGSAYAASDRALLSADTGPGFRGPQPGTICTAADSTSPPSACDDGPFGKGAGGELRYKVTVGPRSRETVWIAVAAGRGDLDGALRDPDRQLAAKAGSRTQLGEYSKVDLPGDRQLQNAVDWGKQNLADLTQTATDLNLRFVDEGKAYPAPLAKLPRITFFGAGYPDYPWLFATDGEYTAFAAVAVGQFETIEQHLIALRDVSDALNARSGKVAHEIVTDGSVYYGANSSAGNTDETAKFPSTVALVWRWTGDDRFRDSLYDFSVRNLKYIASTLDTDHDGWPEGLGNVERPGMGPEKLDNTVYFIRGLYDLADMAASKHDRATEKWAGGMADQLRARFDPQWWDAEAKQYADSLSETNDQIQQKHWIGVTPMEVELTGDDGETVPGLAPLDHGTAALADRETSCFSGDGAFNHGLFHTGCGGGANGLGERVIFSLNTSIQAVGEGNYGRLGADQQQRYTTANAAPMFEPDEQPGALPEILPSPDQGANVGRCWTCRSMVMQAWGQYGIAWPVIHQQLGVRPSLGTGRLEVVPQVPDGQPSVAGRNIRLGDGTVDVSAARGTTTVTVRTRLRSLAIGTTLPAGSKVRSVTLDGGRVRKPTVRVTNRGVEVTVSAPPSGRHTVTVSAA
ncbi:hypothetical protein OM076_23940 [Solirubrobacter ginsenosidimutans]|uniref:Glycogen debranching protein n=1 Tax=Solirubrobacter ginsenosidimutans TaxID=490573 RepID=A0A9X3S7A6_9ACTN|nr:hypothetical protein [Solirubrobacter ginsenosidimutans]MDA0163348.1 hypothetical protein [Solirubrobacter ginsenosidimutans]